MEVKILHGDQAWLKARQIWNFLNRSISKPELEQFGYGEAIKIDVFWHAALETDAALIKLMQENPALFEKVDLWINGKKIVLNFKEEGSQKEEPIVEVENQESEMLLLKVTLRFNEKKLKKAQELNLLMKKFNPSMKQYPRLSGYLRIDVRVGTLQSHEKIPREHWEKIKELSNIILENDIGPYRMYVNGLSQLSNHLILP